MLLGRLRRRLRREADDRRRRLVADRARSRHRSGSACSSRCPWDQANTRHSFSVELLDSDGAPVGFDERRGRPTRSSRSAASSRSVGRPGLKPGTPLDFPVAVNSTPLPLEPGPLRVAADDRRRLARGLDDAVHRPRRRDSRLRATSVRRGPYARNVANDPSRIDLLELDIDLRLADLWREAVDVSDWSLEIVAAFIRAAYGKGYCDALTEESPGSLCVDHGYRMPDRRRVAERRSAPRRPPEAPLRDRRHDRARLPPHGPEGQSGSARDRALGGRGTRRVPPVHVDRGRRESVARSERARGTHRGRCSLRASSSGPSDGDAHAGGLRFRLKDIGGTAGTSVAVRYTGSVPDLFKVGRHVVVDGQLETGTFVAQPGSMITKCPSKYAPKKSGDSA